MLAVVLFTFMVPTYLYLVGPVLIPGINGPIVYPIIMTVIAICMAVVPFNVLWRSARLYVRS